MIFHEKQNNIALRGGWFSSLIWFWILFNFEINNKFEFFSDSPEIFWHFEWDVIDILNVHFSKVSIATKSFRTFQFSNCIPIVGRVRIERVCILTISVTTTEICEVHDDSIETANRWSHEMCADEMNSRAWPFSLRFWMADCCCCCFLCETIAKLSSN